MRHEPQGEFVRRYAGPAAGHAAETGRDRVYARQPPDTTIAPNAATHAPPAPQRPRMALVSWRPIARGSLRGFAEVTLSIGLTIRDIAVLVGKNGPFAMLPSKPQIDKEGRHKTDANGKGAYVAMLEWCNRDLAARFSAAVVELVRREDPGGLDESVLSGERSLSTSPRSRPSYARPRQAATPGSGSQLPDDSLDDVYPDGER
jgi:hypothetical protein